MDLKEIKKKGGYRHPWEQARIRFIRRLLNDGLHDRDHVDFLDVGCGDGYVIRRLLETYPQLHGHCFDIHLGASQLEHLNEATQRAVFVNDATKLDTIKSDLVLLLDVIEHQKDDKAFLSGIVETNLTDLGWLLVTAPAFQSLFSAHDEYLNHYRRYSRRNLLALLQGCGLSVRQSGYAFSSLLFVRFFITVGEKNWPRSDAGFEGLGDWRHGPLLTGLVTSVLSMENTLLLFLNQLGIVVPGLSVWALCEKQPS